MAALTDAQISWLRSEVGASTTEDDLQARFDRLGSIRDVAMEVLRERRASYLEQPLSLNLAGVASVDYTNNVAALERRLTALANLDDDPSDDDGADQETPGPQQVEMFTLTRSRRR